jgi:tetratricopeptide (TPR) repeat protein
MLVRRASVLAATTAVVFPTSDNPLATAGFWVARLTALKVMASYLGLLVWPASLSCDYSYSQIPLFSGRAADYAALAVVLLVIVAAVAMHRYCRIVFFFGGFAALTFLPTSNLIFPIGTVMAERFLYLPAIAAAVALVVAVQALATRLNRPKLVTTSLSILVALLAGRTWARNVDWQDDVSLMSSAVAASPNSFKTHIARAAALAEASPSPASLGRAVTEARRGLVILETLPVAERPPYPYYKAGEILLAAGDARAAMDTFARCNEIVQTIHRDQVARAAARGQRPPGIDFARQSELDRGISQAALRLGDTSRALAAARRAVDTNPTHPDGFRRLSAALAASGQDDDAAIALVEGVLATEDMTLRQDLTEFYRSDHDHSGCAVRQGPDGAVLNPEYPAVHAHACAAVAEALRMYVRVGLPDVARRMKQSAAEGSGCPTAPLDAILQ